MLTLFVVFLLLATAIYVFAKGLIEPIREAVLGAPARFRGLLGIQTMASLQRQAATEVSRRALVSISARHLPNDVLVLLHPEDHASVATLEAEFCQGVATLLDAAVRNGGSDDGLPYKLLGEPKVRLKADPRISRGTVGVVASILEETELIGPQAGVGPLLALDLGEAQVPLEGEQVVGRSRHVDIRLEMAGVSREHTKLSTTGMTVNVQDLGGPNGTLINGFPIEFGRASIGDRISFGPQAEGVLQLSETAQMVSDVTTAPVTN